MNGLVAFVFGVFIGCTKTVGVCDSGYENTGDQCVRTVDGDEEEGNEAETETETETETEIIYIVGEGADTVFEPSGGTSITWASTVILGPGTPVPVRLRLEGWEIWTIGYGMMPDAEKHEPFVSYDIPLSLFSDGEAFVSFEVVASTRGVLSGLFFFAVPEFGGDGASAVRRVPPDEGNPIHCGDDNICDGVEFTLYE